MPTSAYAPDVNKVSFNTGLSEKRKISGTAMTFEYEFEDGSMIRSITGYRDSEIRFISNIDYSPIKTEIEILNS